MGFDEETWLIMQAARDAAELAEKIVQAANAPICPSCGWPIPCKCGPT